MKAVGYQKMGPIDREDALVDIELEHPVAGARDLLVKVHAVSVNPVDTKVRQRREPEPGEWLVLGYDAAGVVEAVGRDVENFKPGDAVFYAGAIDRQGTNSEYHVVDERLVGKKPQSLNYAEAAALPLTSITAWEMLFHRLALSQEKSYSSTAILLIGGAGGVGSIAIQLLRALTDIQVIATASRPETKSWALDCGAHYVIDHRDSLSQQIADLGLAPQYVFSTTHTNHHYTDIIELIAPQGHLGVIDDPGDLSIMPLKQKSLSLHWEFMFTRSLCNTPDISEQGDILNKVASLVDAGTLRSTLSSIAGKINAAELGQAHAVIESGKVCGKIVLEGF
ncbi:MAG: zinc-binding alcohol dehydrogenase family protein [Cellvibrionaceae bacterium]|nr:zinc-binding alcohol dehydrogenase family protein [Cellvibrionaceae bacterium]